MLMQGVIVFYLLNKGYGYLRVPDTREEFYFRASDLRDEVKAGDWVTFELKERKGQYLAHDIRLVMTG